MYWLEFFISALIIIFAGVRLTDYADKLSVHLGLGKVWVGIVLLGLVTSLPEVITSLVSLIKFNAYDLAIGNLIGSNSFNPMLLVVMDIVYRSRPIGAALSPNKSYTVSCVYAVVLTLIVMVQIAYSDLALFAYFKPFTLGGILIAVLYFVGMKTLSALGTDQPQGEPVKQSQYPGSPAVIWLNIIFSSILVMLGAVWLAYTADTIAQATGLGGTFVGSIFLAFVTSLPEIVVSLSALKVGAFDLAIGNIFGSNMTNMFIVFICGLFSSPVPLLSVVSKSHIIMGFLGVVLMLLVLAVIHSGGRRHCFGLSFYSLLMTGLFIGGTGLLYYVKS